MKDTSFRERRKHLTYDDKKIMHGPLCEDISKQLRILRGKEASHPGNDRLFIQKCKGNIFADRAFALIRTNAWVEKDQLIGCFENESSWIRKKRYLGTIYFTFGDKEGSVEISEKMQRTVSNLPSPLLTSCTAIPN